MFLYIARHAWAGGYGDPRWPDDSQRPLTPEGIERYAAMLKLLSQRNFAPARIATSPYTRCRQTAEIIAKHSKGQPTIEEISGLEPGSNLEALIEWSNQQGQVDLCWVGHNPDVEGLTAALIGDGGGNIRFAKGAVAAIEFNDEVAVDAGQLHWLVTAKLLGL